MIEPLPKDPKNTQNIGFSNLAENPVNLEIVDFSKYWELISVNLPPLVIRGAKQTKNIYELLLNADYNCCSIVVENHYIDKAFTDEYREFYGSSFTSFPNHCKRLHFFNLSKIEIEREIQQALKEVNENARDSDKYYSICRKISTDFYLGFMVVKPLPNTRIGRTVIRHPKNNDTLTFPCTKHYKSHIFGLELSVCGLPFQQQDGGMSACASTATWSSLNQVSEFEQFSPPSPASITKLATKQVLPFGRPIPQDNGLTVDQMCQAVEATGLSPYLVSFRTLSLEKRKSIIYSAVKSGFAPILIFKNKVKKDEFHAVTIGGMIVDKPKDFSQPENSIVIIDVSWGLSALYINDDRISPYHKARLDEGPNSLNLILDENNEEEIWELTHLLIPLHNKIRFVLVGLQESAFNITKVVGNFALQWEAETQQIAACNRTTVETWIYKSKSFQRHLLFGNSRLSENTIKKLYEHLSLPRYIGIIRLEDSSFGIIHILVDTTNTTSHANYLLVLGRNTNYPFGNDLVKRLAMELDCPYLID